MSEKANMNAILRPLLARSGLTQAESLVRFNAR